MKNIILIFALTISVFGYSQKDFQKKEIISTDAISILYDNQRLFIDQRNNNWIHFEIWKNKVLILNSEGSAKGIESFPASKGKYKLIIFDKSKPKTKIFHI
jgi:hypothetical protein